MADNQGEPVSPVPYGSAPDWITVIPAPVDGSRGGWRYADWFMGWRQRFGMANIRCDFEVGTPLRNLKGAVPEAMATTELKFAMDHIAPLIGEMINSGFLSPIDAPHRARFLLAEEMKVRIPGSRAGVVGSTRTPPTEPY